MSSAKSDETVIEARPASVAAVVVTYNRLMLLQECVAALRAQTRRPDEIIVVNNSSTDGTADWLASQPDLTVITQPNTGSSGGQYTGTKVAYQKGHDWFWLMDDDTIPQTDCLEQLMACKYASCQDTGFLASLCLATDGEIFGEAYFLPTLPHTWALSVLQDGCVRVARSTFVSLLVHRRAVQAVGLPVAEFFLMIDDWEFTERISKAFKNYCVLESKVVHKAPNYKIPDSPNSRKRLLLIRNRAAWIRLQPLPRRRKIRLLVGQFTDHLINVVLGRGRIQDVIWYWKGLMMPIRIESAPTEI